VAFKKNYLHENFNKIQKMQIIDILIFNQSPDPCTGLAIEVIAQDRG
jgi:hypothetical protein